MINRDFVRVAVIDLSTCTFEIKDRPDLVPFLGGTGLAYHLFAEEVRWDQEALAPEQPVIFANGCLSSLYPGATRVTVVFRSPLNGYLGESYTGGSLGTAFFQAGYEALVIKGRSERPVYITVGPRLIHIKKIDPLYGTDTEECWRYLFTLEPSPGIRSLVINGQAGERLVNFAGLNVDRYWHLGGAGAGAVFGSKNLKALMVYGDRELPIPDPQVAGYRQVFENLHNRLVHSQLMPRLHGPGTTLTVDLAQANNCLPTKNMTEMNFEQVSHLSAETLAKSNLVRQLSCTGCPIGCVHVATYRRMFGSNSLEYEESHLAYDGESVTSLGPMLGIQTRNDFFALLEKVAAYGLDPVMTGVVLGWVTEALQKGVITEQDTGTSIRFGYVEGYLRVLDGLVGQVNDFYQRLARGVGDISRHRGGSEYALAVAGVPLAAPFTGYDDLLTMVVGRRRDGGAYPAVGHRGAPDSGIPDTVRRLVAQETMYILHGSLGICPLIGKVYDLKSTSQALKAVGIKKSSRQLRCLANQLCALKHKINRRLGFDPAAVFIPERFFSTLTPEGYLDKGRFNDMVREYLEQTGQMQ